jgi:AcrR family transcriptional regulator
MMIPRSKESVVEEFRIQTIKEAAMRVIARKGLAGANMQEIADEAGIAKGTIYLYFKNQQELLEAVVDHSATQLLDQLKAALASPGTFRQRFQSVLRHHIEFFDNHRDLFQVHAALRVPEGDINLARCDRANRPQYQAYMAALIEFLEKAIENDEIRCTHPARLASFIEEGTVSVLMQRMTESRPAPVEEIVEWVSALILDGIAKRRSRS